MIYRNEDSVVKQLSHISVNWFTCFLPNTYTLSISKGPRNLELRKKEKITEL